MKQETLRTLADGAIISAISTGISAKAGWLDVINAYAPAIGAISSVFFGVVGLVCYYLSYRKSTQSDENKKDIATLQEEFSEHKKETIKQFDSVNSGISKILKNQSSKRRLTDKHQDGFNINKDECIAKDENQCQ